MTKDEALRIALEALGTVREWEVADYDPLENAITALHQALEEPKQDMPCGWVNENGIFAKQLPNDLVYSWKPVYAPPRKREWVGLTDEDIAEGAKQSWVDKQAFESAVWWAESKLREKNGF